MKQVPFFLRNNSHKCEMKQGGLDDKMFDHNRVLDNGRSLCRDFGTALAQKYNIPYLCQHNRGDCNAAYLFRFLISPDISRRNEWMKSAS